MHDYRVSSLSLSRQFKCERGPKTFPVGALVPAFRHHMYRRYEPHAGMRDAELHAALGIGALEAAAGPSHGLYRRALDHARANDLR